MLLGGDVGAHVIATDVEGVRADSFQKREHVVADLERRVDVGGEEWHGRGAKENRHNEEHAR